MSWFRSAFRREIPPWWFSPLCLWLCGVTLALIGVGMWGLDNYFLLQEEYEYGVGYTYPTWWEWAARVAIVGGVLAGVVVSLLLFFLSIATFWIWLTEGED